MRCTYSLGRSLSSACKSYCEKLVQTTQKVKLLAENWWQRCAEDAMSRDSNLSPQPRRVSMNYVNNST